LCKKCGAAGGKLRYNPGAQPNHPMSVIPLTLTISLCLVFTFVVFFIREQARHTFSSAERDSLLPLTDETPRPVTFADRQPDGSDGPMAG
jgi:hypothetical protein